MTVCPGYDQGYGLDVRMAVCPGYDQGYGLDVRMAVCPGYDQGYGLDVRMFFVDFVLCRLTFVCLFHLLWQCKPISHDNKAPLNLIEGERERNTGLVWTELFVLIMKSFLVFLVWSSQLPRLCLHQSPSLCHWKGQALSAYPICFMTFHGHDTRLPRRTV